MASSQQRIAQGNDDLNDSWVELHYSQQKALVDSGEGVLGDQPGEPLVTCTGSLEKLLMDAQRESRTPSRPNSTQSSHKGSPKSPSTPNSELSSEDWQTKQDPGTDWIWDWSSGPEALQSLDKLSERLRHPGYRAGRPALSVRNSEMMKKTRLFSWTNLPTLLLTHACSFFLGAAAVFLYLRKYCNLPSVAHVTMD